MYCKNCGFKNEDGVQICANCGEPLSIKGKKTKKKSKGISKWIIGGVAAVVILVLAVFLFIPGDETEDDEEENQRQLAIQMEEENQEKYDSYVEEAKKYMMEQDYDLSISYCLDAIEIEPEQEAAYLYLIDSYINIEDMTNAKAYLIQAIKSVGGKTDELTYRENKITAINGGYVKGNVVTYCNGHYYEIWSHFESVEEANDGFKCFGGYVADITSKEEDEALYQLYVESGQSSLYFGLVEGTMEGDFRWMTGEQLSYNNFAEGEPNNNNGNEAVGSYYWKYPGTWNDSLPTTESYFICEYDYE